jgi:transcriptional regulator with XRE-family HTH domain
MTDIDEAVKPEWTLGCRLWRARRHAGLTRADVAILAGISERALARYEADEHAPSDLVLSIVATVCGVDEEWLIGRRFDLADRVVEIKAAREAKRQATAERRRARLTHGYSSHPLRLVA